MHSLNLLCVCVALSAPGKSCITALAVTPDGKATLHASHAGVFLGSDKIATKVEHVRALVFAPDGKTLAVAGGTPGESGIVELLSWPERKPIRTLEGHDDVVTGAAFLDAGKRLATSSFDRTVKLWDCTTGKETASLEGHSGPILCLALSNDGKFLCSGSSDQTIRVWNPADAKLIRSLDNHLGAVHALAFRPGKDVVLASCSEDGTVRVWHPANGRMVRIARLKTPTLALAWNADGSIIHAGSKDGMVRGIDGDGTEVKSKTKASDTWITALTIGDKITIGSADGAIATVDR